MRFGERSARAIPAACENEPASDCGDFGTFREHSGQRKGLWQDYHSPGRLRRGEAAQQHSAAAATRASTQPLLQSGSYSRAASARLQRAASSDTQSSTCQTSVIMSGMAATSQITSGSHVTSSLTL